MCDAIARGVALWKYLRSRHKDNDVLGVGYDDYWAIVHNENTYRSVRQRNWQNFDANEIINHTYQVTVAAGGPVTLQLPGGQKQAFSLDAWVWRKAHVNQGSSGGPENVCVRSASAFQDCRVHYDEEVWEAFFPDPPARVNGHPFLNAWANTLARSRHRHMTRGDFGGQNGTRNELRVQKLNTIVDQRLQLP
jgi:hypothetical protein